MTKELEDKLVADFPEILKGSIGEDGWEPISELGIECGDGWEPIIRNLCKVLNSLNTSTRSCRKKPAPFVGNLIATHASRIHRFAEKLLGKPKYSCNKLNTIFNKYIPFPGLKVKLTQVKEKFGTLRIYHSIEDNFTKEEAAKYCPRNIQMLRDYYSGYVYGAIDFAEEQSELVCERDGNPGKLYPTGWWKVMCPECAKPRHETPVS